MHRIIVIGTLHAGLTPSRELKELLIQYQPSQLLVEIVDSDLQKGNFHPYPKEMIFAAKWAKKNHVPVSGYDVRIDTIRKGITKSNIKIVLQQAKTLMKKTSWKDMNQQKYLQLLNTPQAQKLTDPKKVQQREITMLKNIKSRMLPSGTVIILTGCGHLSFFEKHLKTASFPLRSKLRGQDVSK